MEGDVVGAIDGAFDGANVGDEVGIVGDIDGAVVGGLVGLEIQKPTVCQNSEYLIKNRKRCVHTFAFNTLNIFNIYPITVSC